MRNSKRLFLPLYRSDVWSVNFWEVQKKYDVNIFDGPDLFNDLDS